MPESPLSLSAESFSEVLSTGTVNTSFLDPRNQSQRRIPLRRIPLRRIPPQPIQRTNHSNCRSADRSNCDSSDGYIGFRPVLSSNELGLKQPFHRRE